MGNVDDNSVSSYRLHTSETQQLLYVWMAVAEVPLSFICVELLEGGRQPVTGRVATHLRNTVVKIRLCACQHCHHVKASCVHIVSSQGRDDRASM